MSSATSEIEAVAGQDRSSLEDWLVHTGFHDDNYREQELIRFRSHREALRVVDQEIKDLEENLLQLRLQHISVYKEHIEMEQKELDLLARLDQLRLDRASFDASEPLPPIILPPLHEIAAGTSQGPAMEDGEILDTVTYSEQQDQPEHHEYHEQLEQHEQHEQREKREQFTQAMQLDQSRRASPALSRSPSLVLSPGSPYRTPSQDGSHGSSYRLRGGKTLRHNQSRDRTRSPDVITRSLSAHHEYRDRSSALSYTKHDGRSNGLDLGGTVSNTRFFMLKSTSINNVYASQDENLWACGYPTIEKLCEAFTSSKDVILFFSANRSFGFQGYARMLGLPSPQNLKPSWHSKIKWRISDPFPVGWICTTSCAGDKMGGMRNSLVPDGQNPRGQLAVRSRDGEELDAPCGYAIKCILDQEARGATAAQN